MRKPRTLSLLWLVAAMTVLAPAPAGHAAGTDAGAGTWRMIVLSGPTQITVAAPGQTSSVDYQAELNAIKNAQSRLTASQRKAIDYWSGGGVIRWNEILMGLVSRYNLPPAPNPDDPYTTPDANNPFSDPPFPVRQPAIRGARLQLCLGRAVRRPQGRVVLQVPLQPSGAGAGG